MPIINGTDYTQEQIAAFCAMDVVACKDGAGKTALLRYLRDVQCDFQDVDTYVGDYVMTNPDDGDGILVLTAPVLDIDGNPTGDTRTITLPEPDHTDTIVGDYVMTNPDDGDGILVLVAPVLDENGAPTGAIRTITIPEPTDAETDGVHFSGQPTFDNVTGIITYPQVNDLDETVAAPITLDVSALINTAHIVDTFGGDLVFVANANGGFDVTYDDPDLIAGSGMTVTQNGAGDWVLTADTESDGVHFSGQPTFNNVTGIVTYPQVNDLGETVAAPLTLDLSSMLNTGHVIDTFGGDLTAVANANGGFDVTYDDPDLIDGDGAGGIVVVQNGAGDWVISLSGSYVTSLTAQRGVENTGTASDPILELDIDSLPNGLSAQCGDQVAVDRAGTDVRVPLKYQGGMTFLRQRFNEPASIIPAIGTTFCPVHADSANPFPNCDAVAELTFGLDHLQITAMPSSGSFLSYVDVLSLAGGSVAFGSNQGGGIHFAYAVHPVAGNQTFDRTNHSRKVFYNVPAGGNISLDLHMLVQNVIGGFDLSFAATSIQVIWRQA